MAYIGKVIGGSLKLRQSESTSSAQLALIPNGTVLAVVAWNEDDWFKTSYNGVDGYVMRRYVSVTDTGRTANVLTQGGSLNIRQQPNTTSSIIYTVANTTTMQYLYTAPPFHCVSTSAGTGWAHQDYILL